MKILLLHNRYVFPGGEDSVVEAESFLLRQRGHEVLLFERDNALIEKGPLGERVRFFSGEFLYSGRVYQELSGVLKKERPDIVHVHNPFYMMTPSAYEACLDAGVPVVQTLHNYRFLCAAATFFRDGRVCEECLEKGHGAAVRNRCWKGSLWATLFLARQLEEYRKRKILERVRRFIVLSQFSHGKFIQSGWPAGQLVIKPNVLKTAPECGQEKREPFVLYVGALQPWKGIKGLVDIWSRRLGGIPLKIIGSGPLEAYVRERSGGDIEFLGQKSADEIFGYMRRAYFLVVPSECYETFSRVSIEAYACGLPVVASRLGALEEMVRENETGLLFRPGDGEDLANKVRSLFFSEEDRCRFSRNARLCFEENYSAGRNVDALLKIYGDAL